VWEGLNAGVRGTLSEIRALLDLPADAPAPQPPDVPMLYLYGAETSHPVFLTPDVVASVLPAAKLRAIPGQRHFAPVLDPTGFAEAILEFTSTLNA
jgi:pimeloyl-ACP methyl ester carboxylesterase